MATPIAFSRAQLESLLLEDVEETGKELGRGAYGVVTEVKVAGLVCAGKKLHDAIVQEFTKTKFGEECMCHSQQRHPNIVQLMGVYYPPNAQLPMLVMEYLPLSLTQCLETHTDLPLQFKYSILLDVAKGLAYLHRKQPPIVHRDLTANNILLTSNFTAKISDLGVSRMADTFKRHHLTTAPGNAIVMPPEALEDNPHYDHKLDVFSYGCLIIHILTGQFPQPTKPHVPKHNDPHSFIKVSEWDRRLQYIEQIPKENELLPLVKQCLTNQSTGRPEMIDAIELLKSQLLNVPLKNPLELFMDNKEQNSAIVNQAAVIEELSTTLREKDDQIAKHQLTITELQCDKEKIAKNLSMEISNLNSHLTKTTKDVEMVSEVAHHFASELKQIEKEKDNTVSCFQSHLPIIVPSYSEQIKLIAPYLTQKLVIGDKWCVVSQKWWNKWKVYTGYHSLDHSKPGYDGAHPGPVDNAKLFIDGTALYMYIEGIDYTIVPEAAWNMLVQWYGLSVGSQPIIRSVVEVNGCLDIELHMWNINLKLYSLTQNFKTCSHFSRLSSICDVITKTKQLFSVRDGEECRLWACFDNRYELLSNPQIELINAGIFEGHDLLLEVRQSNGVWPRSIGLVGFTNEGYHSYINSIIHCIINTPHLTEYFLRRKERILSDGATKKVSLTDDFGKLMKEMRSGTKQYCDTQQLIKTIPLYYERQDTHKIIARLLAVFQNELLENNKHNYEAHGDKEDFEKVLEKTDIEWSKVKHSIITRLFCGLIQINSMCSNCKLEFPHSKMFTSLLVPLSDLQDVSFYVIKADPLLKPLKYCLSILKKFTKVEFEARVKKDTGINYLTVVIKNYNETFFIFQDGVISDYFNDKCVVYVFELTKPFNDPSWIHVPIIMKESLEIESTSFFGKKSTITYNILGFPLLIIFQRSGYASSSTLSRQCLTGLIYSDVLTQTSRYITKPYWNSELFDIKLLPENDSQGRLKEINCIWTSKTKDNYYDTKEAECFVIENLYPSLHTLLKDVFITISKETVQAQSHTCSTSGHNVTLDVSNFNFQRLPEMLILNLKKDKSKVTVIFPLEKLDLSEVAVSNSDDTCLLYDLYAVYYDKNDHHYAYVKNNENGKWYHFDSVNVTEIEATSELFCTSAARILFYQKRHTP